MKDDNVIDFTKRKEDADKGRSHLIVSFDLYLNSDNSEAWAAVTNVDMQDIDAGWHRFIADQLRHLAWLSDGMAAEIDGEGEPIATIAIFEDRRISARWNDDLVQTKDQVEWIRGQLLAGVDEIEAP